MLSKLKEKGELIEDMKKKVQKWRFRNYLISLIYVNFEFGN